MNLRRQTSATMYKEKEYQAGSLLECTKNIKYAGGGKFVHAFVCQKLSA